MLFCVALVAAALDVRPAVVFASGDFTRARAAAVRVLARTPRDAAALLVAGTVALYENDLPSAQRCLVAVPPADPAAPQAARALAEVRRRELERADRTTIRSDDVVPYVRTEPLPAIEVTIDGHRAVFVIDTGAPGVTLDAGFAASLGLRAQPATKTAMFADGKPVRLMQTRVTTLGIGRSRIHDLTATLLPLRRFMPGLGRVDGAIGTGIFENFAAVVLDGVRGALVTYARPPAAPHGAASLPLWLAGDHFLITRGTIAGQTGDVLVDTGLLGGAVVPSPHVLARAHLRIVHAQLGRLPNGAVARIASVVVPEVRLGSAVARDQPGVVSLAPAPAGPFRFETVGTISGAFFRHRTLTIDFTHMRLLISERHGAREARAQAGG